jgi:MFS family permease
MNSSSPTLLASLRALPRPAWILFLGVFLNKFGTFVVPFLTLILTRQGYSLGDAGLAIGAYGAGHFLASGLGGHLADTLGRRKTIMLSMFSAAITMILLSQARSMPAILLLTALAGLAGELYRPASSALLADLVPASQRVTAFSVYRMAFNAGWAFGPATAGFLAEAGYFWLFIGDAITSILFGLVAFFALPHGVRSPQAESKWSDALKVVRCDRRFHLLLAASFAIALVFFQISSTYGLFVTQIGFSAATYGAIISLNGVLVVFCELPISTITRRFPARRVIGLGYALVGMGFALNAFARTRPALVVAMIVVTLGEMLTIPVSAAYVADLAPAHMRGRYMGAFGLTWALGLTVGPSLGMALFHFGAAALWLSCGALGLLASAIIMSEVRPRVVEPVLAAKQNQGGRWSPSSPLR